MEKNSFKIHTYLLIIKIPVQKIEKESESDIFLREHPDYESLETISDRLRWCRYTLGLTQKEVAKKLGISRNKYQKLELGILRYPDKTLMLAIGCFYEKPPEDFGNEYLLFLNAGQGESIRAIRKKFGMTQKELAKLMGIPLNSLQNWETETKKLGYKSWEKYFKDKM